MCPTVVYLKSANKSVLFKLRLLCSLPYFSTTARYIFHAGEAGRQWVLIGMGSRCAFLLLLLYGHCHCYIHWMVTEDGKIEYQVICRLCFYDVNKLAGLSCKMSVCHLQMFTCVLG